VATPLLSVTAVAGVPLGKLAPAPLLGAVNVTVAFAIAASSVERTGSEGGLQ